MRGQEALIAMRRRGAVPDVVWLETDAMPDPCCKDWLEVSPRHAHLQLDPDESPARADLRCLVGLNVSISGSNLVRVRATRDACIAANAKRVIASTTKVRDGRGGYPTVDVIEITDTDGYFTHTEEHCHG